MSKMEHEVTLQDFLMKYGTRMASMALRQSKTEYAEEIAKDLQAALEHYITNDEMKHMTVKEVVSRG